MNIENYQDFVLTLIRYWTDLGCMWAQPYDLPMGAGTFHPHTFLKGIGPEPWRSVYIQPCRRPVDGRYGESTYRFQYYNQLQVFLKPVPENIVDLFVRSLQCVGIDLQKNDISLKEDDWKGPTLGAWGLGWEVRANAMEITQFTYFQQLGGLDIDVIGGEITYGSERLYMYAKGITDAREIPYNNSFTIGDIWNQNEFEFSHYNFTEANTAELFKYFSQCEENVASLCSKNLILPAYDFVLHASHAFNLLDARKAISVSERQRYIGRVRELARRCANLYREHREKLGFPLMSRLSADPRQSLISPQEVTIQSLALPNTQTWDAHSASQKASADLSLELGVEEMPPSFLTHAQSHLAGKIRSSLNALADTFAAQNPSFSDSLRKLEPKVYASPRRLALTIDGLPSREPDSFVEQWGPAERIAKAADGSLTPAALGFCRKNGLSQEEVSFKAKADGTFLYAKKALPGRLLHKLLADQFFGEWVHEIESTLKMKWLPAEISAPFVRPVRWVLAMADSHIIPVEQFGLKSGSHTYGQRILSPERSYLSNAKDYSAHLNRLHVEPDWAKRRAHIAAQFTSLAASVGGISLVSESLLDTLAGLAEDPLPFIGAFDKDFLKLPARLIPEVLREHLNYGCVTDAAGHLMPYYLAVATYKVADLEGVKKGAASVVAGRLADGCFYYEGDLKTPIQELHEGLKLQLFQANMGTLHAKTERISQLAQKLAELAKPDLKDVAAIAGLYSKADLRTGTVGEFPDEMQGIMGEVLVAHQTPFADKSAAVAKAIGEHYLPTGQGSAMPSTPAGTLVALADKLDSLAVMLTQGADTKSNKDPFGLRRYALGVLKILGMDGQAHLALQFDTPLDKIVKITLEIIASSGMKLPEDAFEKVMGFVIGRLKAQWRECFEPSAVEAVLAPLLSGQLSSSIASARQFAASVSQALATQKSFAESVLPYRRARNLTESLSGQTLPPINSGLFAHASEGHLFEALVQLQARSEAALKASDWPAYLLALGEIAKPLADFFEGVMVNDPNESLKCNRLALLRGVRAQYEKVADFSLIQLPGDKK